MLIIIIIMRSLNGFVKLKILFNKRFSKNNFNGFLSGC